MNKNYLRKQNKQKKKNVNIVEFIWYSRTMLEILIIKKKKLITLFRNMNSLKFIFIK